MALGQLHEVVVVGAGLSGLTTALVLAEIGFPVRILSEREPSRTGSAKAGASWGPHPGFRRPVLRWCAETFGVLARLAAEPGSGVRMIPGTEAFEEEVQPPSWAARVPDFVRGLPPGLPARYRDGWRYTIPIVDMPMYLDYLAGRFVGAGGTIEISPAVTRLGDVSTVHSRGTVVVNCTGLGSRALVPDTDLRAVRGQLVMVENPGIGEFFQDNPHGDDLTYIFPHEDYVVLGGHASSEVTRMRPDPHIAAGILDRCQEIDPRLRGARVIGHRVGLRPQRPTVRVEWDESAGFPLVHNYGHGGAGLTLSWGCAFEVANLVGEGGPARPA
ncbi:FAD-dependent oxidoreductase [Phytomonospora sp. NPDC050363]|uniref:FAD-dependent oxidoreductase n=1 Tax=Phytomonospora sp. NPDC050363 TaxID=3155642 RepID=UPI0033D51271